MIRALKSSIFLESEDWGGTGVNRNEIVYQRTVRYLMVVDENYQLDEDG